VLRIGHRKVVHVETFILPEDEEAIIEFSNDDVEAKFRVRFEEDRETKETTSFEIEPDPLEEDRGLLSFKNWNRPHRVMNSKPSAIMTNGEMDLMLLISSAYFKNKYHVTMQFMLEDKDESSK
jgi:hypothetical protein